MEENKTNSNIDETNAEENKAKLMLRKQRSRV